MTKRIILGVIFSVLALVFVVLMVVHQRQVAIWPSLKDELALAVPVTLPPTNSWHELQAVVDTVPPELRSPLNDAISE